MATSAAHRFGQIIGAILENVFTPILSDFCNQKDLYLDRQGDRVPARGGKKVSWEDKYGNIHDLDFVIEKGGTKDRKGTPVAFIEAAWRRYTKHSKNKAQEIQGAILPIAEVYEEYRPFLGVILAGEFTNPSIAQLKSVGFHVLYIPYESIVRAFEKVGINVRFSEQTPEEEFQKCIKHIETMSDDQRSIVCESLEEDNKGEIEVFLHDLRETIDSSIEMILVYPLYGQLNKFSNAKDAMSFIEGFNPSDIGTMNFRKFEIMVHYTNGDKISASFEKVEKAKLFLQKFAS